MGNHDCEMTYEKNNLSRDIHVNQSLDVVTDAAQKKLARSFSAKLNFQRSVTVSMCQIINKSGCLRLTQVQNFHVSRSGPRFQSFHVVLHAWVL